MNSLTANNVKSFITQNAIYIVLVFLIIGIALMDPRFLSITSLRDVLLQSSTRAPNAARRVRCPTARSLSRCRFRSCGCL